MNPVLVNFGNFEIRWYAVFILVGMIVALLIIKSETKRFNIKQDFIFNMFFWTIIFGLIGARLYYVMFNWDYYSQNLIEIVQIWKGGLAIHGGIIAGLLTIVLYTNKYKLRTIRYLDFIVVGLSIAQSIGRWGNFFNSEAHGAATTLEHLQALHIPKFIIDGMKIEGVYYTPTFLYESIACFILFIVMLIIRRGRYRKVGTVTAVYLLGYGIIRFLIEISRTDALMLAGFKVAQIVSVIMVIVGLGLLFDNSKKGKFEDLYNDTNIIDKLRF